MSRQFIIVVLFSFLSLRVFCNEEVCKSDHAHPEKYLGTKSAYRFIANLNVNDTYNDAGCRPIKIWMVVRHGTRYPGTKVIYKMQERLPKMKDQIFSNTNKGSLCNREIEKLKGWILKAQPSDDKNLAHEGEDEMLELAERMQIRFPTLFPKEYSNDTYKFKYTATQRCAESARYFTIGLFGRKESRYVWFPESVYRDPILRFYKRCDKWRKTVKKNPQSYLERNLFENSTYYQKVQSQVTEYLGLNYLISPETLNLLYTTCAFDTAWSFRDISPWCSVFSEESLKIMEYAEDLKYYWIDGYGYQLTYQQACPAVKNLFEYFDIEEQSLKATIYFTHSGTMLKLLSHFGLYNDTKSLRHDGYEGNENRKWRVSKIDSFASNLGFVLYDCNGTKKVLVLHQEKPVTIQGCPDAMCSLDTLKDIFKSSIRECKFDEICMLPNRTDTKHQKYDKNYRQHESL